MRDPDKKNRQDRSKAAVARDELQSRFFLCLTSEAFCLIRSTLAWFDGCVSKNPPPRVERPDGSRLRNALAFPIGSKPASAAASTLKSSASCSIRCDSSQYPRVVPPAMTADTVTTAIPRVSMQIGRVHV